ncbi:MAG: PEGA domain-containing protein [Desulfomonilia bacterium]|nr:PEGA domain-containing protein [Desulfomonilia bacterium]
MQNPLKCSLLIVAAAFMTLIGGCSGPSQYDWVSWYQWRGNCFVKLIVDVESDQAGSSVFLDGQRQCTTPCTLEFEAAPFVTGQERRLVSPTDGTVSYETRNTRFNSAHPKNIMVEKESFRPVETTIVLEDFFASDTLRHHEHYTRKIRMTFSLKTELQEDFRRVVIDPLDK